MRLQALWHATFLYWLEVIVTDLNYQNPKDLGIKKIHELLFGIEWFEKKENQETCIGTALESAEGRIALAAAMTADRKSVV